MSHSVRRHLRLELDDYDRSIRCFLPAYEEMLSLAANLIAEAKPEIVLDLGAGTGALTLAVLERCESCQVELIDIDPEMLDQARERLAPYASRVRFTERAFQGPLPECDVVTASLALHHVPTMSEKRALYDTVHDALRPGGLFVNADVTMPADPSERQAEYETWAAHLVSSGIEEERVWEHFREWEEEDFYFPLEDELTALAAAGFAADCPWRVIPSTLTRGVKSVAPAP